MPAHLRRLRILVYLWYLRSLEVRPQGELDLTIRANPDLVRYGRCQYTEVAAGVGHRKCLSRLQSGRIRCIGHSLSKTQVARICKIRAVENVIELRTEFNVCALRDAEFLAQRQIQLREARSGKTI